MKLQLSFLLSAALLTVVTATPPVGEGHTLSIVSKLLHARLPSPALRQAAVPLLVPPPVPLTGAGIPALLPRTTASSPDPLPSLGSVPGIRTPTLSTGSTPGAATGDPDASFAPAGPNIPPLVPAVPRVQNSTVDVPTAPSVALLPGFPESRPRGSPFRGRFDRRFDDGFGRRFRDPRLKRRSEPHRSGRFRREHGRRFDRLFRGRHYGRYGRWFRFSRHRRYRWCVARCFSLAQSLSVTGRGSVGRVPNSKREMRDMMKMEMRTMRWAIGFGRVRRGRRVRVPCGRGNGVCRLCHGVCRGRFRFV